MLLLSLYLLFINTEG